MGELLERLKLLLEGEPEVRKEARRVLWFWYDGEGSDFTQEDALQKISEFEKVLQRRKQVLGKYHTAYTTFQAEDLKHNHTREFDAASDLLLFDYAPTLHYKPLPNEIVFDLEKDDESQLKKLLKVFEELGVEATVYHSGGSGFHVHALWVPEGVGREELPQFLRTEGVRELTDFVQEKLLRLAKAEGFDESLVDPAIRGKHWIRAPYSHNKFGGWKLPFYEEDEYRISELPKEFLKRFRDEMQHREKIEKLLRELEEEERRKTWLEERSGKGWIDITDEIAEAVYRHYLKIVKEDDRMIYAHCPFHPPDEHPSFTVEKTGEYAWIYTDWHGYPGGEDRGNVVKFVKKIENLSSYKEAIRKIREIVGGA